jgi:molybdate transport system substrate-binding protein
VVSSGRSSLLALTKSAEGNSVYKENLEIVNPKRLVIALSLFVLGGLCTAQDITIAAAADLQFAMQDVAARFQKETGKSVRLIYGSSGNFFQQIQNGAPFDMFFSANLDYPKKLQTGGLTEPDTYYAYAIGKIVIWVRKDSKLDVASGLKTLLNPSIKKIAIANPQHAPYGQAAVAAMKKENVYDNVADKFVLGENISQTASFVVSGSADTGIVALSLALSPNMKDRGRYAEIPTSDYPPIEQACVIMKSSRHKDLARAFLNFVKTPAVAELFRNYGFAVPSDSTQK